MMGDHRRRSAISQCTIAKRCTLLAALLFFQFTSLGLGQDAPVLSLASSKPAARNASQNSAAAWPHELQVSSFRIYSTVPVAKLEPHLSKLATLPKQIHDALQIEVTEEPIHLVVLDSPKALHAYAKRLLPSVPERGALYIRHRGPGLVLTCFDAATWITDARHECTHALLDASKVKLPLWLDEGLAEYFETSGDKPLAHGSHLSAIQAQLRFGQVPDLERLEKLTSIESMSSKDYRDAWSVTALLLHSGDSQSEVFRCYLQDLQQQRAAGLLSHRLHTSFPAWRESFTKFYRRPL